MALSIETETSRATVAEKNLVFSIISETSRAILAEFSLASSIDSETARANAAEISLTTHVSILEFYLNAIYLQLFQSDFSSIVFPGDMHHISPP